VRPDGAGVVIFAPGTPGQVSSRVVATATLLAIAYFMLRAVPLVVSG
jgi:hypothetical protein